MRAGFPVAAGALAGLGLIFAAGSVPAESPKPDPDTPRKEATEMSHARGSFEVEVTPESQDEGAEGGSLGRFSLDKSYHGDLEGTGQGEMLTARTPVEGSAGYVAIERVSGTLGGRAGSFVLQHRGVMSRGEQQLSITVVPDSGTGELAGIEGSMGITIEDGKHFYTFDYSLPESGE